MTARLRRLKCIILLAFAVIPHLAFAQDTGASLAVVTPVTACASLAQVDLRRIGGDGSRVTDASEVTQDGLVACSVKGTLAPTINFEVLLPTKTWTQRYLQLGCGGLCGQITLQSGASEGCKVMADGGFVIAATDMGHSGGMDDDGSWGQDSQKRVDFAFRAQHLTAIAAKALTQAYYGQAQKYAYFNGCSDGGREALMEAMRFPGDFNGVIAGAPAMLFQVQNTLYHAWQAVANTDANGKAILLSGRLPILHNAVLAACDRLDGAMDGLIANPAACQFDPASITCTADTKDTSNCLTPAEATVARKLYEGPKDPKTSAHLTAGQPQYGSELEWSGVFVPSAATEAMMSSNAALPAIRYLSFEKTQAKATLAGFSFSEATLQALRARHPLFDATNPDLSAFERSGGKLILWHGLADPHISPANTLSFHKAMLARMGAATVGSFERLYLLPGVAHCGNGQGPSRLDLLTPMLAWVENGKAPDAVMTRSASQASEFGAPHFGDDTTTPHRKPPAMLKSTLPAMSRPVYPYPAVASYTGIGSVYDAANWAKGGPAAVINLYRWPGSDLFERYDFNNQ